MGFVGVTLSAVSQYLEGDLALPGPEPRFRLVVRLEKYVRDPHDGNRTELAAEEEKPHDSTLAEFLSLGDSRTAALMSEMSFVPDVDLLSHEHLGPAIMRYAEEEARIGARLMRLTKLEVVATVIYHVGLDEECAGLREVMPPETPAIVTYRFRSARTATFLELMPWKGEEDDGCCAVCWEEFGSGETVARTPCRHVFHRHCIMNWMHRQGTCPLCRYSPWNPRDQL